MCMFCRSLFVLLSFSYVCLSIYWFWLPHSYLQTPLTCFLTLKFQKWIFQYVFSICLYIQIQSIVLFLRKVRGQVGHLLILVELLTITVLPFFTWLSNILILSVTWSRLFQNRVVRIKFDIYVFFHKIRYWKLMNVGLKFTFLLL